MHLGYMVEVNVDGGGGYPYYTVNLEKTGEKQTEGHSLFHVASESQEKLPPPEPHKVPSNTNSRRSQVKNDWQAEKAYLKQMSELAQIVYSNNILRTRNCRSCFYSKNKALQLYLALSQKQESAP
jgi:hypothetical protein